MTGGAGTWTSGCCQVTVNDAPLADRAPGDASACAAVAYRWPKPGLASSVIASAVFGYPGAEAVGHSLDLIIPEQFRARHWEGFGKVMQTGVTRYGAALLAMPAVRKDGVRISVEFSVTLLRRWDSAPLPSQASRFT